MGIVHPGERNPNWRGGRTVASNGYVLVKEPESPMADARGYVYEHRLVMSRFLGRPLNKNEQVHHKNGNKLDNRLDNLEYMPSVVHHRAKHRNGRIDLRMPDEVNPRVECSCGCGATFDKYDRLGRPRRFKSGHNGRATA